MVKKYYSSRWGRFKLSGQLFSSIRGKPGSQEFNSILSLMSQILIIKADYCPATNGIEYMGISELFDELEEGAMVPEYYLEGQVIEENGELRYICKAFRVKD